MINKKLTKKEKIILSNKDKVIEKDKKNDELKNVGLFIGSVFILLLLSFIYSLYTEDKESDEYYHTQNSLFYISFACIFYNLVISIFSVNIFKEYLSIIKSIIQANLNFRDSLNQLMLANMLNLIISILILIFIIDWSFWGGYKVKITTTLIIFFTFTIIEIIKSVWQSKFKK